MNRINTFLQLIRFKNLLIISFIQVAIKFCLINVYLKDTALNNHNFIFYLTALISIVAAGYIINDIYDIEIDKINKPQTRIIQKELNKDTCFKLYYLLNIIGLSSGFYVAYQVNKLWLGIIFVYFTISLWRYSKENKRSFLIGNLQVAFLTALSIINIAFFDLLPYQIKVENGFKIIFIIILFYSIFAFITTLIREIIKDIEDIEGDKKMYAKTLAIQFGAEKTKKIITLLNTIPILAIAYFQYFQYSVLNSTFSVEISYWGVSKITAIYTLFIQILLILLMIKTQFAKTKKDFHSLSTFTKIIMILGILSIPLFTSLHML